MLSDPTDYSYNRFINELLQYFLGMFYTHYMTPP